MDYKNINDYEQLYLIAEQDEDANTIVYEKYKPIVYSLATKYLRMFSDFGVTLDELVQEGFIGLSKAISAYKDNLETKFYTFSTVCMERQIKSYCRKFTTTKYKNLYNYNRVESTDDPDSYIFELKEEDTSSKNPDVYLENSLYNDLCIRFKNILSTSASLVFELKYNGFKNKEISKLLEMSPSAIDRCVKEIRKKAVNYLNI